MNARSRFSTANPMSALAIAILALVASGCGSPREAEIAQAPAPDAAPAGTAPETAPQEPAPAATQGSAPAPAAPQEAAPVKPKADAAAPAPAAPAPQAAAKEVAPEEPPKPREPEFTMVTIPQGKRIHVTLAGNLSSKSSKVGETVSFTVNNNVSTPEHRATIIPSGSVVTGEIVDVKPAKTFSGNASVTVKFGRLALAAGQNIDFQASLAAAGEDTKDRTKKGVGGGAAAGALAGGLIGKDLKGAVIGAAAGAAIGTGVVAASDNKDIEMGPGTSLVLNVDQSFQVPVPKE